VTTRSPFSSANSGRILEPGR